MRGFSCTFACVLFILTFWSGALALPRFALMAGAKCGSCHVNPTGGQIRTDYGLSYGMDALPLRTGKGEGDDAGFTFNPKLSENFTIGADFRRQFIIEQTGGASAFHLMTMSLYGSVQLQKRLVFFFKQDLVNETYGALGGPEVFIVAKILPGGWYVKGGDFLPDYGWRLDDHTAYVRGGDLGFLPGFAGHAGLIFLPNYKDIGMEFGGYAGGFFITAGVFSGSGNTQKIYFENDKAYSAKIEYSGNIESVNFRLGASGYGYKSYKMGGIHAGLGTADVALLGEVDVTHNTIDPFAVPSPGDINESGRAMAAYGELDIRAVQGVWFTGKYDVFDPIRGVTGDALKRLTIGMEFFPYPFVEFRPQYRLAMETPSIDNNTGLVQLHVWF